MKAAATGIEEKVDALLVCLDKDVQHLQEGLLQLDELRRLVIERDDDALSKLLEKLQMEKDDHKCHERNRQSIRQELATVFGYDLRQMTLSALETILPKEKKDQVTERKEKIRSLIEQYRKEHLRTVMFLSDCARFNNMLLKSIFDLRKVGSLSYNANGTTKQETDMALINLQL